MLISILVGFSCIFNIYMVNIEYNYLYDDLTDDQDNDLMNIKNSYQYSVSNIHIDNSNPSINWEYWKSNYDWCTGDGTNSVPYVIEGVLFSPGYGFHGIHIENSDVYFSIKNCGVQGANWLSPVYNIYLDNVSNGKVVESAFSNNRYGLYFVNSVNNSFSGNLINNNVIDGAVTFQNIENWIIYNNTLTSGDGFTISGNHNLILENEISLCDSTQALYITGNHNKIIKNDILDNKIKGIDIYNCRNNTIAENIIYNNRVGIELRYEAQNNHIYKNNISYNERSGILMASHEVKYNNITENIVDHNIFGINLYDDNGFQFIQYNNISLNTFHSNKICGINIEEAEDNIIGDNNFFNSGIHVSGQFETLITNDIADTNLVNNKKLYFYKNEINLSNSNFTNPGQIILIRCNNSRISNQVVNSGTIGLSLLGCTNIHLSEIESHNNILYGIFVDDSNLCSIKNSVTNYNGDVGIYLKGSNNCKIDSNEANNNYYFEIEDFYTYEFGIGYGVLVNGPYNNTVINNTASFNQIGGVSVSGGTKHHITENYAEYNNVTGIYITSLGYSEISSNIVYANKINGLHVAGCVKNIITQNKAQNHLKTTSFYKYPLLENIGILLTASHENDIFENEISSNTNGLYLYNSMLNTIDANDFKGCGQGFSHCFVGLFLDHSSNFNTVSNNTIQYYDGLRIYYSTNNSVISNHISSDDFAIDLRYSYNNTLEGNLLDGDGNVGVWLEESSYNKISRNVINNMKTCIYQYGNCIGNIFEDNDCTESDPWAFFIIIMSIVVGSIGVATVIGIIMSRRLKKKRA
jgi:parallel beta-helix repeat protein